jgi:gliding motility-associated-like protein
MKPFRKIVFLLSLLFGQLSGLRAQSVLDNRVYRVTAYKLGNTSVTSVSNYAEVIPPLSIYIPNAFTPNGDGINDSFGVKGEGIKDFRLVIFNRWGDVIFESTEPRKLWDGRVAGKPVEQGVYVYQLYANGNKKGRTGSVSVIY